MTTDNGDKRVLGALVTVILGLSAYVAYWAASHTPASLSAADGDPCCAVQRAALSKTSVPTNALAKVLWLGCATSACQPKPQPAPIPTPVPVVDAGPPPAPSVAFPQCNPGQTYKAPSPDKIERWRKSLPPRHKLQAQGVFLFGATTAINPVFWVSNLPWCGNQGNVGACEAFTQLDIATTRPRTLSFSTQAEFNSAALKAYEWITNNDPYPGAWPQQDTGSDSISGCKWLVANGYAKSCQVLSGVAAVKAAIQSGPVITGMNWLDGMFTPDRCGQLSLTGAVVGGHAEALMGYDPATGICLGSHCGYHVLTSAQLFGATLDADFVQPVQ